MKQNEMEDIICQEYSKQIELIIENAIEERPAGQYKPDKGAAAGILMSYVENTEKSPFIDVVKARERFAELKHQRDHSED